MLPYVYGEIHIRDAINLLNEYPIIGEEFIDIEWRSPGVSDVTKYRFIVSQVLNVRVGPNNKYREYTIRIISDHFLINSKTHITQKYNQEIHLTVDEIVKNKLNIQKPLYLEETKGVRELVIANMKPYEAIDKLRRQSVSKKYTGGSFIFCETGDEMIFSSLENLFERKRDYVEDRVFFFDADANVDFSSMSEKAIVSYLNLGVNNTMQRIGSGGLNTKTMVFDMFTKSSQEITSENTGTQYNKPQKSPVTVTSQNWFQKYGDKPGMNRFMLTDTSKPLNTVQDIYSSSKGFISDIISNIMNIEIYGDSTISISDIITLQIPIMQSDDQRSQELDPLVSGNYMVSKIRHMFTFNARIDYKQSLQVLKGSYGQSDLS